MELDKIEQLLEKYFEATTTVAEEESLRSYFSQENIPTHLAQYTPLFQHFTSAKQERFTKKLPIPGVAKTRIRNFKWLSVAAAAVLMLGLYFGNEYRVQLEQDQKDAEYAYNETKKALSLLAENFNKGTEKVAYLNEFETTKKKIYKSN